MATLIVTKTDFDIEIPKSCKECIFTAWDDTEYGDCAPRCSLLKSDEDDVVDDDYPELYVGKYCIESTKSPRCPIISMKRDEA